MKVFGENRLAYVACCSDYYLRFEARVGVSANAKRHSFNTTS